MDQKKKGILSNFKILLQRNRLGELMVMSGKLSTADLHHALSRQKEQGGNLGQVLLQERLVSRSTLYNALAKQWSLRCLAASMTLIVGLSAVGIKQARAGSIRDIPSQVRVTSATNISFAPIGSFPSLFGSQEKRSTNLAAFTKWSGMFDRFERSMQQPAAQRVLASWHKQIKPFAGQPLEQMARNVNDFVNGQNYIVDSRNWGQNDYWETPVEFFQRGGDCEDFAIAKYSSLRALGVPDDRMRIAIVHDQVKNMPHAVLIVYADSGAMMLDQQIKDVRYTSQVDRYRPIFTINRTAWWMHTAPGATVLASAQ